MAIDDQNQVNQIVQTEEVFGDGYLLPPIDLKLKNEDYVKACIDRAREFFNKEAGNNEAKKRNLSECRNTKVETPLILRQSLLV